APPGSWPAGSWSDRLLGELRRYAPLRARLARARVVSPPVAVRGLRNVWRESTTPGLLLLGDAAVQTDPLFGQGISWALRGGEWAANDVLARLGEHTGERRSISLQQVRSRTFVHRFLGMSAFSTVPPGSMVERLLIAGAAASPKSTALVLRLILGFATVSREQAPRRSLATWLREALAG